MKAGAKVAKEITKQLLHEAKKYVFAIEKEEMRRRRKGSGMIKMT